MFDWLKSMFDPEVKAASKEAVGFFQGSHSDRQVLDVSLRSKEEERFVFAIFYRGSELVKPPRYSVIAVNKEDSRCEELEVTPESPYFIRGRK